jgi:glyoxylase-like metal-dependent hydrolase (beta-lactamase superfamily II)
VTSTHSLPSTAARLLGVVAVMLPLLAAAQATTRVDAAQAGFYRTKVGDVEVIALSDGTKPTQSTILTNIEPVKVDALMKASFESSPYQGSVNAFLFKLDGHVCLVDAGTGELYGPTLDKLPLSLKGAGVSPEQVTDIYVTHIHTDHTGGMMDGTTRVFPNAIVHVERKEVDFWFGPGNREKAAEMQRPLFDQAKAKFGSYLDAGQVRTFDGATELLPGFRSLPAPGHTPGHTFYVLESRGRKLVFWGDVINVAEVQLPVPTATVIFDILPDVAIATRRQAFEDSANQGYLVAFAHMPFPGFGHVGKDGQGYRFFPLRYENDAIKVAK